MRKFTITSLIFVLLIFSVFPSFAFAKDKPLKIFIDGVELKTDQPPVIENGRTLVPLRSIFEALNAKVDWKEGTRKITATRENKTIILFIDLKETLIDGKQHALDVPPRIINGRTLVPIRFVSESLGDFVYYDNIDRNVMVTKKQMPVTNVTAQDIANNGNGSDLNVSFKKASNESIVSEYRIMVVKTSKASSFDIKTALSTSNYTPVEKKGWDINQTLTSSTRDVDGASIEDDISYTIFVLQVGNGVRPENALGKSSPITLTQNSRLPAISNLQVKDVNDFGDGRDIEISFSKIPDETRLLHYRVYVVPSTEATKFNLSAAKESYYYTYIYKSGNNIVQNLSEQRDYTGKLIGNGTSYTVFVLSYANASLGFGSALSSPSALVTLSSSPNNIRASNIAMKDIFDYGDGRDIEVSFTIPFDEARVIDYRVMVVPSVETNAFTLQKANNISSSNYTVVAKNGSNRTVALNSTSRDVNGNLVQKNKSYTIFILSMGGASNGYSNSLSTPSQTFTLTDNFRPASASNLRVFDYSDYGDGRDMHVTFNKISDESVLQEYRIMVVKSAQSNAFTLATANNVTAANYTSVAKTGTNISRNLTASSRDAYGEIIREGVEYRVYILSVSGGGNSNNNSLSWASPAITLRVNASAQAAFNVTATDIGNDANGSDMEVRFSRVANEAALSEYRIMVVKSNQVFDLARANTINVNNYTAVPKTGGSIIQRLSGTAVDVDGDLIRPDIPYRVYILSVSNAASTNALSIPSSVITLSNPIAESVTSINASDIANNGNGSDLQISFNRATNETNIAYYMVMVVPESEASTLTFEQANIVPKEYLTRVNKTGGNLSVTLSATSRDIRGNLITNGIAYRVFVLSIADGITISINGFVSSNSPITLTNP